MLQATPMAKIRSSWIVGWALGALLGAAACSGGDARSSSPCDALCRCVRDEGGDRSECRDRCEAFLDDPTATVSGCRSEISSYGYPMCASYCDELDDGESGSDAGSSGKPGSSGGSVSSGGRVASGGAPASGGSNFAGSTAGGSGGDAGGGTGGSSGGKASGGSSSGGEGGASACSDPEFPVYCPARNGAPADCWSPATVCSTVVACGEDAPIACARADATPDCNTRKCTLPDPCATTEGSGLACGQSLAGGTPDVLYWCSNGETYASAACPGLCHAAALGEPNFCLGDDPCVSAVIDGEICGANLSPNAEQNVLYTCQDQQVVSMRSCVTCQAHPPGEADICVGAQGGGGSGGGPSD